LKTSLLQAPALDEIPHYIIKTEIPLASTASVKVIKPKKGAILP